VTSALHPYAPHNQLVQLPAADAGRRIESGIAARELGRAAADQLSVIRIENPGLNRVAPWHTNSSHRVHVSPSHYSHRLCATNSFGAASVSPQCPPFGATSRRTAVIRAAALSTEVRGLVWAEAGLGERLCSCLLEGRRLLSRRWIQGLSPVAPALRALVAEGGRLPGSRLGRDRCLDRIWEAAIFPWKSGRR